MIGMRNVKHIRQLRTAVRDIKLKIKNNKWFTKRGNTPSVWFGPDPTVRQPRGQPRPEEWALVLARKFRERVAGSRKIFA